MPTLVPLIDQQRRMVEVGRIRLGRKVTMNGGKTRPEKLSKLRFTSRDRRRIDAIAELYKGEVAAWEDEHEVYTDATEVPIAVVPGQALSRYFEQWGQKTIDGKKTPVICLRRCDGELENKSGGPCLCANEDQMVCKPTSRLSVVLTDVPGLGVWRLESHGWNASAELAGTVELLEMLVASNRPIVARLRLDERTKKTETGTNRFVVPVIDIDHTLGQVLTAIGGTAPGALEQPTAPAVQGFKPVPELPAAPAASIGDQVGAVESGQTKPAPRKNAQQPIPRTGIAPRTAAEASSALSLGDGGAAGVLAPPENPSASSDAGGSGDRSSEPIDPPPADDDGPTMPLASRVALWIKNIEPDGLDSAGSDDYRHQFMKAFSAGKSESATTVKPADVDNLLECIDGIRKGELALGVDGDGWWLDRFLLVASEGGERGAIGAGGADDHGGSGQPSSDPSGIFTSDASLARDEQPTLDIFDEARWRAELETVPGIGVARLLKTARSAAADLGITPPTGLDEITDPGLVDQLRAWLNTERAK